MSLAQLCVLLANPTVALGSRYLPCGERFLILEKTAEPGAPAPLEVTLNQVSQWGMTEIRAAQGRLLHFSEPGSGQYVTLRQVLRTEEQFPHDERGFLHRILDKSHKPRFIAGAIENIGGTEKGLFRLLLEKELSFLEESKKYEPALAALSTEQLRARAEMEILSRYSWKSDWTDWLKSSQASRTDVENYRRANRIKVQLPHLVRAGEQTISDGVEIGALRLTLGGGPGLPPQTRTYFYTSRDFHSMGGTDELLARLRSDPKFPFSEIQAAEVFHNHPGPATLPLSAADARQISRIQKEVEAHLGRRVPFAVHAVQEKQGHAFVFSAKTE